jgi:hypothetical protein
MKVLLISEGEHELGGALATPVHRLNERCEEIEWKNVRDPELRSGHGKGHGIFKKAIRCLIYAQEQSFDAVILVVDQDDEVERRRHISAAQEYQRVSIRRALGLAIRTFDAWMLADETALATALGCQIQKQPDPETLRDAKDRCEQFRLKSNADLTQAQMYAAVAEHARIDELERRCPDGFATFSRRVRSL